ncbi:MAG: PD-(D/E)XK nuclease family protein [Gammaproteobacteria bacterium]|nr:PD-(D/E)XK nuclease family protein [Gammaproteobacteria bacterium]
MVQQGPVVQIALDDDLLDHFSQTICQQHEQQLPNLNHLTVLVPDTSVNTSLRAKLLQAAHQYGCDALSGPRILTLQQWASLSQQPQKCPTSIERELILAKVFQDHPELFSKANTWALSEQALQLFDQLTLNNVSVPNDFNAFTEHLSQCYALKEISEPFTSEARIVHTLWHAWHQQQQADNLLDKPAAFILGLHQQAEKISANNRLYLAGFSAFSHSEAEWLLPLLKSEQAILFIYKDPFTDNEQGPSATQTPLQKICAAFPAATQDTRNNPSSEFLKRVFERSERPLIERAKTYKNDYAVSPVQDSLSISLHDNSEDEANAIDIQVRLFLADEKKRIGIITEDRRLARRVRALLERSGILLNDEAGWPLSTTSAAAIIERWLECIESDFEQVVLLDFLKSPFLKDEEHQEAHLHLVNRLEADIMHRENISRGMLRYKQHIQYRKNRLDAGAAAHAVQVSQALTSLLNETEEAAQPLLALQQKKHSSPLHEYISALLFSLKNLQCYNQLENDIAGKQVIELIEQLDAASQSYPINVNWTDFRSWFGRQLETAFFKPEQQHSRVVLTHLDNSYLASFDAVIIAAADKQHLPGQFSHGPFFNDHVYHELGLQTYAQQQAEKFQQFFHAITASQACVFTTTIFDKGEALPLCPWLEAMMTFHTLAYQNNLENPRLRFFASQPSIRHATKDDEQNMAVSSLSQPVVDPALIPDIISASNHQALIDCPYRFMANSCLKLRAPDEIIDTLRKAEYGERIHKTLEAFHGDVKHCAGPFKERITANNQTEAIALLSKISQQVFNSDIEDNFEHRGWLHRWLNIIPAYIKQQIKHQQHWSPSLTEQYLEAVIDDTLSIKGRIDRIDRYDPCEDTTSDLDTDNRTAIIDYKTGKSANLESVLAGEDVQLATYALLNPTTSQVEYLQLDQNKARNSAVLDGDDLHSTKQQVADRLQTLFSDINTGAGMPAWGDDKICSYCDYKGLCRKQAVEEAL